MLARDVTAHATKETASESSRSTTITITKFQQHKGQQLIDLFGNYLFHRAFLYLARHESLPHTCDEGKWVVKSQILRELHPRDVYTWTVNQAVNDRLIDILVRAPRFHCPQTDGATLLAGALSVRLVETWRNGDGAIGERIMTVDFVGGFIDFACTCFQ
jgi:hypothetical protein